MIREKIKALRGFIGRLRTEPVLIVTAATIALTAFQSAQASGLSLEDTAILIAEAILGWLARELVVPTAKIEGSVNYVEQPLERPLGGE